MEKFLGLWQKNSSITRNFSILFSNFLQHVLLLCKHIDGRTNCGIWRCISAWTSLQFSGSARRKWSLVRRTALVKTSIRREMNRPPCLHPCNQRKVCLLLTTPGDGQERCIRCNRGNTNSTIQTLIKMWAKIMQQAWRRKCVCVCVCVQAQMVSWVTVVKSPLSLCSWLKTTLTCNDRLLLMATSVAAGVYFIGRHKCVL